MPGSITGNTGLSGWGSAAITIRWPSMRLPGRARSTWNLPEKVFADIHYAATKASSRIAREKGSYEYFEGSGWQNGMPTLPTGNLRMAGGRNCGRKWRNMALETAIFWPWRLPAAPASLPVPPRAGSDHEPILLEEKKNGHG